MSVCALSACVLCVQYVCFVYHIVAGDKEKRQGVEEDEQNSRIKEKLVKRDESRSY